MLSRTQLEELSFSDLKDLVKASELTIPQHANAAILVDMMLKHYGAEEETKETNTNPPPVVKAYSATGKGKYGGYETSQEYIEAMLTPVLCVVTAQSPEFSRQRSSAASVSVGNALVPNFEFTFIADGNTVTSIPRIAINRIKEMKVLLRGADKLKKETMRSTLQGSGFGKRFVVRELNDAEIAEYAAEKKAKIKAAVGTGV